MSDINKWLKRRFSGSFSRQRIFIALTLTVALTIVAASLLFADRYRGKPLIPLGWHD